MDGNRLQPGSAEQRLATLRGELETYIQELRNPDHTTRLACEVDLMREVADRLSRISQ